MIGLLAQDVREIEWFGQVDFANQTTVHPVGLALLAVCCIAVFALPRRLAFVPLLVMAALIPAAQRIVLVSLDFSYLRILILCGLLRILINNENATFVWTRVDRLILAWAGSLFFFAVLRTGGKLLIYQCGFTLDALGAYFLFRCLVRDWGDVRAVARTAVFLSMPLGLAFLYEQQTARNLFAMFGGVSPITLVREDRLRCEGPYNHPILAGCFWAALLPLCAARWWGNGTAKLEAVTGTLCCLAIVYASASSTPLLGVLMGAVGAAAFLIRGNMRALRWCLVLALIGLHMVMKAPVWHLVSRVSAVGGSTGHHRYLLIDSFIKRFTEWAPLGVNSTAHWFWGGQDVTNQFILQGVQGGVITFVLFVWLVAAAYGNVGRTWRSVQHDPERLALSWALGVSLLVHTSCFIGVSYFGQIITIWYMTLAVIAGVVPGAHRVAAPAAAPALHGVRGLGMGAAS